MCDALLPTLAEVYPIESVSATVGLIKIGSIPKTSANCCAIEILVPPMSTAPVIRLIVPSSTTFPITVAAPLIFPLYPKAMPRPTLNDLLLDFGNDSE